MTAARKATGRWLLLLLFVVSCTGAPEPSAPPRGRVLEISAARPVRSATRAHAAEQTRAPATRGRQARYRYQGRNFGAADYLATVGIQGIYYLVEYTQKGPTSTSWKVEHGHPLDIFVRNLVVAPTRAGRQAADQTSDHLWYASVIYPFVAAAVIPPIRHSRFNGPWQMTMINLQAFALSGLVIRMPHKWIGRYRPNYLGCEKDDDYDAQCGSKSQLLSFPSGHSQISMTGAGLSCAHHVHGEVLGNPRADSLACLSSVLAAGTVGFLRMRADRHWYSDTVLGAALGFGIGYGLPTLLFYKPFWRRALKADRSTLAFRPHEQTKPQWFVFPQVGPTRVGLAAAVIGF